MKETKEVLQPEFITIKVRRIMRVVAKAILVRIDNGEEHWLPLSQIKPPENPFKQNQRNLKIEVAEWLVENKRIGMSQEMPEDVHSMVEAVREWDKFALVNLADRIRDSDGSWLDDCLRMLVGLSPVYQEIKTIGDFLNPISGQENASTFRRIRNGICWVLYKKVNGFLWCEMMDKSMEELCRHTIQEFLAAPGFGKASMEYLRLLLHQHGFLLEGDTKSAVEEMEAKLWGVEDDNY